MDFGFAIGNTIGGWYGARSPADGDVGLKAILGYPTDKAARRPDAMGHVVHGWTGGLRRWWTLLLL